MSGGRMMDFGIRITSDGRIAVAEHGKVVQSIQPIGTEAKKAATELDNLSNSAKNVGTGAASIKPAVEQIDNLGVSAKQTAAAMRMLPAQITDIVTGLATGQAPITVFLQQGGQLKDMFGGAGAAARGMAAYVAGLVTPFTVAAAAGAVLAAAYYQGGKEAEAYSKAIILSGNAAGVTRGQLGALAGQVATTAKTTQGAAADALTQAVTTGKIASANLELVSTAALAMEKATAKAVAATVGEYEQLGKAPVETLRKLNEQYNFLTAAQYREIKALEDQGKTDEAAEKAQQAYATALLDRAGKIQQNLGTLERAWGSLATGAKKAWDAMLGIGRSASESTEARLADVQAQIAYANTRQGAYLKQDSYQGGRAGGGRTVNRYQELLKEQQLLQDQLEKEHQIAQEKAAGNDREQAAIALAQERDKYLTAEVQKAQELAKLKQDYLRAVTGERDTERVQAATRDYQQAVAGVNRRFGADADVAADYEARISQAQKATELELAVLQQAHIKGELSEHDYQEKINSIQEAGFATRLQLSRELADKMPDPRERKKLLDKVQALEADLVKARQDGANKITAIDKKFADESGKAIDAYIDSLAEAASKAEESNALYGLTEGQIQRVELARASEQLAIMQQTKALLEKNGASQAEIDAYQKQIDKLEQIIAARGRIADAADINRARNIQLDMWKSVDAAAKDVFHSIGDKGVDMAERIRRAIKTGILDMLYQVALRPILIQVATAVSGQSVGSALGSALGVNAGSASGGGLGSIYQGASLYNTLSAANSGYNALYSSFAGSSIGQAWGLSSADSFVGPSAMYAENPAIAATASNEVGLTSLGQSVGQYLPYAASLYSLSQGNYGAAIGSAIGTYIMPGIGTAIGSALGSLLDGGGPDPHNNGQISGFHFGISRSGVYGNTTEDGVTGPSSFVAGPTSGHGWWSDDSNLSSAQISAINSAVAAAFSSATSIAKVLGIDPSVLNNVRVDSSANGNPGNGRIGGYFESVDQALSALQEGIADALAPSVKKFQQSGETLSQTLARVANAVVAAQTASAQLGTSIDLLKGTTDAWTQSATAANKTIAALQQQIYNTADPSAVLELENQLSAAVTQRYNAELQYLSQIQTAVKAAMDSVSQASTGVSSARQQILGNPVKSAAELRTAIAAATAGLNLPSTEGVQSAQATYSAALAAESKLANLQASNAQYVSDVKSEIAELYAKAGAYGVYVNANAGPLSYRNDALGYDASSNRLAGYGQITYTSSWSQAENFKADSRVKELVAALYGADSTLASNNTAIAQAQATAKAIGSSADASASLVDAQKALSDALTAYAGDAKKATDVLSGLKDETLRYYEAQSQLSQLMTTSAANLGATVTDLQRANMTGADRSADILAQFRSLYTGASDLSGADLAGRADQLNNLAQNAIQAARDAWASGPEFQSILSEITGDLSDLQQRLTDAAPKDYQAESLALLSGIDLSLSKLQDNLESADSVVVAAINGSKSATVQVLTEIRDRLDHLILVSNSTAPALN